MNTAKLADYVSRVRAYLATDKGRRNLRRLMGERGRSYTQAVAEIVMYQTRLVIYERITAVTDEVVLAELGGEAA